MSKRVQPGDLDQEVEARKRVLRGGGIADLPPNRSVRRIGKAQLRSSWNWRPTSLGAVAAAAATAWERLDFMVRSMREDRDREAAQSLARGLVASMSPGMTELVHRYMGELLADWEARCAADPSGYTDFL